MHRKQVSIVLWGTIHRDQEALQLLNEFIQKASNQKIPLVFCEEDHAEQTLESKREGNKQFVSMNSKLLTIPAVQSFLKKDKALPYFALNEIDSLREAISSNFPISSSSANELAWSLLRHQAYLESIKLIDNLIKLNIPYSGIEFTRSKREAMVRLVSQNYSDYLAFEQSRIEEMKNNILSKVLPKLKENAIIVVLVGVNHVQRLAAHLTQASKTGLSKYNVKLFPLKLFSPYVIDGIPAHEEAEAVSRLNDSPDILKIYDKLAMHRIMIQKEVKGPSQFTSVLSQILNHTSSTEVKTKDRSTNFDFFSTKDLVSFSLVSKKHAKIIANELTERKKEFLKLKA